MNQNTKEALILELTKAKVGKQHIDNPTNTNRTKAEFWIESYLEAEKEIEAELLEKTPQAALTELFLELKTEQTPAVVERIVNDIDAIVRQVRFPGWQKTASGEREIQKSLRQALLKYKDNTTAMNDIKLINQP